MAVDDKKPSPTDRDLGRALAEARQAIKLVPKYAYWSPPACPTVGGAAVLLGIDRVTLTGIEAGRRSIKARELDPFAIALGTTAEKLLARARELAVERVAADAKAPASTSKKVGRGASVVVRKPDGRRSPASKKTGQPARARAGGKKTGQARARGSKVKP